MRLAALLELHGMRSSVASPGEIALGGMLLICCSFSTMSSDSGPAPGRRRDRDHLSRRAQAPPKRGLQSKGLLPTPTHVVDAVRTCRPTRQHKIGVDLSLEGLALLADHRQSTLWIDIALKIKITRRKISALEGGKTVANGHSSTGYKIGAAGGHVPEESFTVISIERPGRVGRRSGRWCLRGASRDCQD